MVATGTGLAPYMSQLRSDLRSDHPRRIGVLHGARHSWDLGYRAELITMQRLCPNLIYLTTVSRPDEEPVPWGGATGYVQDLWAKRGLERAWGSVQTPRTHMSSCAENPEMVDAMTGIFAVRGVPGALSFEPGEIHAEKFW